MFRKTDEGEYVSEGLLSDGIFQYHERISISPELKQEAVQIGDCKTGPWLYSSDFASCIAVCARLKNKEYAILHSTGGYSETLPCIKFINLVKDQVGELYVFQKKQHKSNDVRAPILAIELMIALNLKDVTLINIPEGYRAIVAISQPGMQRIILTNEIEYSDVKNIDTCKKVIDPANVFSNVEIVLKLIKLKKQNGRLSMTLPRHLLKDIYAQLTLEIKKLMVILGTQDHGLFGKKNNAALSACLQFLKDNNDKQFVNKLLRSQKDIIVNPKVTALVKRTLQLCTLDEVAMEVIPIVEQEEKKSTASSVPKNRFGF